MVDYSRNWDCRVVGPGYIAVYRPPESNILMFRVFLTVLPVFFKTKCRPVGELGSQGVIE